MKDLINEVFELKKKLKELEDKESKLKEEKAALSNEIDEKEKILLEKMKEANSKEIDLGEIVATMFSKENVSYTSDKDVLNYLKEHDYNDLITTKITEALNKNNLKKALKTDEALSKALEEMTIKTTTDYVVVTSKENHMKMLEHIDNSKK